MSLDLDELERRLDDVSCSLPTVPEIRALLAEVRRLRGESIREEGKRKERDRLDAQIRADKAAGVKYPAFGMAGTVRMDGVPVPCEVTERDTYDHEARMAAIYREKLIGKAAWVGLDADSLSAVLCEPLTPAERAIYRPVTPTPTPWSDARRTARFGAWPECSG